MAEEELFRITAPGIHNKQNKTLQSNLNKKILNLSRELNKNTNCVQGLQSSFEQLLHFKDTLNDRLHQLKTTLSLSKVTNSPESKQSDLFVTYNSDYQKAASSLAQVKHSLRSLKKNKEFQTSELEELKSEYLDCLAKELEVQLSIDQLKFSIVENLKEQNVLLRMNGEKEIQQVEAGYSLLDPPSAQKVKIELKMESSSSFIWIFFVFLLTILIIKHI